MAKRTGRLQGMRVLVVRPEPAAARLADAFTAEGAVVHRVPALAIAPVEDTKSVERLRRRLADVSVIVFTSVNAVERYFGMVPDAEPDRLPAVVLAVGRATADALRARGVAGVHTPHGRFDSEGLLDCPQLEARRVIGRLVAVVKGEGGRDLLGKELVRRGADVVEASVYRRRAPERLAEMLEAVRESVDIVAVTSAEALENLAGAAPWGRLVAVGPDGRHRERAGRRHRPLPQSVEGRGGRGGGRCVDRRGGGSRRGRSVRARCGHGRRSAAMPVRCRDRSSRARLVVSGGRRPHRRSGHRGRAMGCGVRTHHRPLVRGLRRER